MLIDIHQFQVPIKCGEVFRIVEDADGNNLINSAAVSVAQLTLKNDVLKGSWDLLLGQLLHHKNWLLD